MQLNKPYFLMEVIAPIHTRCKVLLGSFNNPYTSVNLLKTLTASAQQLNAQGIYAHQIQHIYLSVISSSLDPFILMKSINQEESGGRSASRGLGFSFSRESGNLMVFFLFILISCFSTKYLLVNKLQLILIGPQMYLR